MSLGRVFTGAGCMIWHVHCCNSHTYDVCACCIIPLRLLCVFCCSLLTNTTTHHQIHRVSYLRVGLAAEMPEGRARNDGTNPCATANSTSSATSEACPPMTMSDWRRNAVQQSSRRSWCGSPAQTQRHNCTRMVQYDTTAVVSYIPATPTSYRVPDGGDVHV